METGSTPYCSRVHKGKGPLFFNTLARGTLEAEFDALLECSIESPHEGPAFFASRGPLFLGNEAKTEMQADRINRLPNTWRLVFPTGKCRTKAQFLVVDRWMNILNSLSLQCSYWRYDRGNIEVYIQNLEDKIRQADPAYVNLNEELSLTR
ncbi:hypothetical protein Salat_1109500 [Sesamum alatum]|uniref:Uncharacterized protein n=1 Tax=Sesamum alatum TaxID=300844 RepID=A0AAE2CT29_9LAMI|nr:hypothetical protein Salat_1109500 [Sesamum alatum]